MGIHRLTVTYNGISNSYTPLNLTYLLIQNGTLPSTTTSVPTSTSHSTSSSRNIGAIIGGTVGLAAILLTIFFLYRCRRKSREFEKESFKELTPYVESPSLYHSREDRPIATMLDSGTNLAIDPAAHSTNRQVVGPSGDLVHQGVDLPKGSVIDLPPAYSLH